MSDATTCPVCHHAAHEPGDCNHGYSPHPTTWAPDGMREDAPGSGCTCGQREERKMSDEKETELEIAQRAARAVGLPYTEDEPAETLRARVRAEWTKLFGTNSGAIVPPWLGDVLNEGQPSSPHRLFAADLSAELAQALVSYRNSASTIGPAGGPYSQPDTALDEARAGLMKKGAGGQ
jgi:hypothetical protein